MLARRDCIVYNAAMAYSNYQQKIISSYYKNLDSVKLQRLSELVTELYLAESYKKSQQLWGRVAKAMDKLGIPKKIADNIIASENVEILAKNLNDWLKR